MTSQMRQLLMSVTSQLQIAGLSVMDEHLVVEPLAERPRDGQRSIFVVVLVMGEAPVLLKRLASQPPGSKQVARPAAATADQPALRQREMADFGPGASKRARGNATGDGAVSEAPSASLPPQPSLHPSPLPAAERASTRQTSLPRPRRCQGPFQAHPANAVSRHCREPPFASSRRLPTHTLGHSQWPTPPSFLNASAPAR